MTIENPIELLTQEHKYILKVVHALSIIDEDLAQGKQVDVNLIEKIISFMRSFADKYHHAKEEAVLFPAMEHKGVPKTGCPLAALRAEHEKGRKLVTTLNEAADAYAAGSSESVEEIRGAIAEIRQLYPSHIWKEDEMVFPMAQRLFSQEEMKKLSIDFKQAENEYGKNHDQYIAFANELETLLGR